MKIADIPEAMRKDARRLAHKDGASDYDLGFAAGLGGASDIVESALSEMTELPSVPVPDVPEENELLDEMRDAELEDVLEYIRQCAIDAGRFGAPIAVERALNSVREDLEQRRHRL